MRYILTDFWGKLISEMQPSTKGWTRYDGSSGLNI